MTHATPTRTPSPLEAQAIGWAHGRGVVVVAAVGNNTDTPPRPWPFAATRLLRCRTFSARQRARPRRFRARLLAPGQDLQRPRRAGRRHPLDVPADTHGRGRVPRAGVFDCAPDDFRKGQGTSFAAPQVSAAACVLFAMRPNLHPEQVTELLTRTARCQRRHRLRQLRDPARRAQRLGPARRQRGAEAATRCGAAAARPARAGNDAGKDARSGATGSRRRDAGFLGRPERRLRDPAEAPPAPLRQPAGTGNDGCEPDPLAAEDAARRRPCLLRPRRQAGHPSARMNTSPTGRRRPAPTTSR